ncbi:MAG: hypothetical protein ACQEQF_00590 [Bacillota bacterium]
MKRFMFEWDKKDEKINFVDEDETFLGHFLELDDMDITIDLARKDTILELMELHLDGDVLHGLDYDELLIIVLHESGIRINSISPKIERINIEDDNIHIVFKNGEFLDFEIKEF